MFLIYNLFYINFLEVFSMKFSINLSSRNLVYIFWTTMEIRVIRPFIVFFLSLVTSMVALIVLWVDIQFKGHLVSFGYSERIYELCGSNFFMLSYGKSDRLRKIKKINISRELCKNTRICTQMQCLPISNTWNIDCFNMEDLLEIT